MYTFHLTGRVTMRAMVLALGAAILTALPARAAELDRALLKAGPQILEALHKKGYRNVGVLPFKVKKGKAAASYNAAPLSISMPGRLENALILSTHEDTTKPIGIIRDAAGAAGKAKVGSWSRDDRAYKALFAASYPLAWGTETVKPSAFLTGVVTCTGNRGATTVAIQVIDPTTMKDGKVAPRDLLTTTARTDRPLLRDLGYGYTLKTSALARSVTSRQRDTLALEEVQESNDDQPAPTGQVKPDSIGGMAFEIRYDGEKQTIRPRSQGQAGREWQVDPIKEGTKLTFVLRRLLGEDRVLGVVVKVNGRSTWREEDDDSIRCKKWLYGLGMKDKEDVIAGFHTDTTGKFLPFQVITGEEALKKASELGGRAGWIDVDVFGGTDGTSSDDDRDEALVSTRGLARSTSKADSLGALRKAIARANNLKLSLIKGRSVGGGLVVAGAAEEEGPPLMTGKLANPVHLGGISIKYWDRRGDGREIED